MSAMKLIMSKRSSLKLLGMSQRFLTWQPSWQSLFRKVIFIEALWNVAKVFDMTTFLKILVQGGDFTSNISVSGSDFLGADLDLDLDPGHCLDPTILTKLVQKGVFLQKSVFLDPTFFGVDLYPDLYPGHFSNPDPHLIWIQVI